MRESKEEEEEKEEEEGLYLRLETQSVCKGFAVIYKTEARLPSHDDNHNPFLVCALCPRVRRTLSSSTPTRSRITARGGTGLR